MFQNRLRMMERAGNGEGDALGQQMQFLTAEELLRRPDLHIFDYRRFAAEKVGDGVSVGQRVETGGPVSKSAHEGSLEDLAPGAQAFPVNKVPSELPALVMSDGRIERPTRLRRPGAVEPQQDWTRNKTAET